MAKFDIVAERLKDAKAISWDQCHKIYVLMDDEQVEQMRGYGYDPIITTQDASPSLMLSLLRYWYRVSCGLKFIQAVRTTPDDPNEGFENLIGQFD